METWSFKRKEKSATGSENRERESDGFRGREPPTPHPDMLQSISLAPRNQRQESNDNDGRAHRRPYEQLLWERRAFWSAVGGLSQVMAGPSPHKGRVVGFRRLPCPTPNIADGHETVTRRTKGREQSRVGSPWHINKRGKAGGKQRDTHGEDGTGEPSYVAQLLVSAKRLPPRATSQLPSSASSCACLLWWNRGVSGNALWFCLLHPRARLSM